MHYVRLALRFVTGMTIMWGTTNLSLAAISRGQEPNQGAPLAALEKGDEVIVLQDTALMIEAKTVGTVRKGDRLVVEQIQGDWLWVHTGQIRGWVRTRHVMSAALWNWYERQPDMVSQSGASASRYAADASGRARAKIFGVTFEITGLQPGAQAGLYMDTPEVSLIENMFHGALDITNDVVRMPGYSITRPRDGVYAEWRDQALRIRVERVGKQTRSLEVNGRRYGNVNEGDHVLIYGSREVYVNGTLRNPRN